jgi:hypothetical protein
MARRRTADIESRVLGQLQELARVRAALAEMQAQYEEELERILAPVQAELEVLDAQATQALLQLETVEQALAWEIKGAVKALGHSVASDYLQAVYLKGRACWNNEQLEGYAVVHPEVLQFRRLGEAGVSIRAVRRPELEAVETADAGDDGADAS